ncbi:hypothetical protein ACIGJO_12520 [Streptomyces sp. NPDC079020]|uniref:hypothetical protein n=1 Tax=Streptomyces sp. NPDC079020 TaxID=3365722 RepID=UPI0037CD332E
MTGKRGAVAAALMGVTVLTAAAAAPSEAPAAAARNDTTTVVRTGDGRVRGIRTAGHRVFLGIPHAGAPKGAHRWARFARTGTPNGPGRPKWPRFMPEADVPYTQSLAPDAIGPVDYAIVPVDYAAGHRLAFWHRLPGGTSPRGCPPQPHVPPDIAAVRPAVRQGKETGS